MIKTYGCSPTTLRFQYGVKFAISGILALYCACWLRLDSPGWSLATVTVLMIAQYVGAMAEKAFFRLCGTITGAILGVALAGNFIGNGPLCLTLLFIVLTFLSYMFGGKKAPYAFLLCGYTLVLVMGGSLFVPEKAWDIGISRTMNISLGIIVTLIVSTVLWPRYAQVEFYCLTMTMLHRLEETAQEMENSLYQRSSDLVRLAEIESDHVQNIGLLQKLMLFGARESSAFALRLPSYNIIVDRLSRIHAVSIGLARARHSNSLFAKEIKPEMSALLSATENECALFRESLMNHIPPRQGTLEPACKALMHHIDALRSAKIHFKNEPAEFAAFAGFATGFLDLATHFQAIREELVRLFIGGRYRPVPIAKKKSRFAIDPHRMVPALKGSITVILAIIFCDWIHPPGADLIPVAAWFFIMLPRTYFYGDKDQKVIRYAFFGGLAGILALILFTFLTPWIANYFYINIFVFVSFFLLGWAYFDYLGIFSQLMYALTLAIAGIVNICQYWPPPPHSFQNWYFGIVVGMAFCALVQRLLWPPLPQNEFFSICQCYFAGCRNLLAHSFGGSKLTPDPAILQTAWNTDQWVDALPLRACVPQERQRLHEFLSQMRSTGYQLAMLKDAERQEATNVCLSKLSPILVPLKKNLHSDLNECQQAFQNRHAFPLPSPPRPSPTERFHSVYQKVREQALLKPESTPVVMEVLGTLHRLEEAASTAWHCRQLVSHLQLENYAGDVAL